MSTVFVIGATGTIGREVAKAYRRDGYTVYGLTRSEEKGKDLWKDEIIPVIGNGGDPKSWKSVAEKSSIIIDATADYTDPSELAKTIINTAAEIGKKRNGNLTFIYTSGTWVYGDTQGQSFDETRPTNAPAIVAWRPAIEELILTNPNFNGVSLRIGLIYGRGGSVTASFFKQAEEGKIIHFGSGDVRYGFVHVSDVAEAYLAAGKAPTRAVRGEIFNIVGPSSESVHDAVSAVTRVVNPSATVSYEAPQNAFAEALALSQAPDGRKARNVLGWEPKQKGFVDGVDTWYASYKAYN
ncbi:hypothetical protein HDV00_006580 [Rhizophlyctis rosea]|nr:hypothetical protein HDV00_006580 [Rhizophlyctis rosea]